MNEAMLEAMEKLSWKQWVLRSNVMGWLEILPNDEEGPSIGRFSMEQAERYGLKAGMIVNILPVLKECSDGSREAGEGIREGG